jgi:putative transposase
MPRQLTQLTNGEIYHIVLRAVGDSVIFKDENDYYRGIFSIYEFNNLNSVSIWWRRQQRKAEKIKLKNIALRPPTPQSFAVSETARSLMGEKRDMLVEVLAFAFMPNHVHLLVRQIKDKGISQFMQKFGGGYANYFNKKHDCRGHLFNQFRAIHIKSNEQLKNVFVYIHTNPISLIEPGWKEKGIKNDNETIKFLENYKWHSYLDYIGRENFKSVTSRDFLLEIMGGKKGCKEAVEDWIKYKKSFKDFGGIFLE